MLHASGDIYIYIYNIYTIECHYDAVQIYHDIAYNTAVTKVEYKSESQSTKDT